jgi:Excalibur calcium-binding domain
MASLGRFLLTVVIFGAAWEIYSHAWMHKHRSQPALAVPSHETRRVPVASPSEDGPYHCDGRTYCSQMKSCAEAKYFLTHCPDVKMDGNNDGVPCESQWCPNG